MERESLNSTTTDALKMGVIQSHTRHDVTSGQCIGNCSPVLGSVVSHDPVLDLGKEVSGKSIVPRTLCAV